MTKGVIRPPQSFSFSPGPTRESLGVPVCPAQGTPDADVLRSGPGPGARGSRRSRRPNNTGSWCRASLRYLTGKDPFRFFEDPSPPSVHIALRHLGAHLLHPLPSRILGHEIGRIHHIG